MLRLYIRLIAARMRAQMQYKVSFWLDLLGFALLTGMEVVPIILLLTRFQTVGGWAWPELALLYGLTSIAFGLAEMIGRGFDAPFELMMQRGTFDGILIRPLGTVFQVLTSEFQLRRLGRVAQGAAVLAYACWRLPIRWTAAHVLLVPLTIGSGVTIYVTLLMLGATLCFWTIKTPEVIHVVTAGGDYLVSYPLSIYSGVVRGVFLSVIPVAFVNYPAALLLLGRTDPGGLPAGLAWASPLVALVFWLAGWQCWRFGVRKYTSAGS